MIEADPYEVLGVEPGCTDDDIKQAWRDAARESHPDAGGDPLAWDHKRAAYELLSDPLRRDIFDRGEEEEPEGDRSSSLVAQVFDRIVAGGVDRDVIGELGRELRRMHGAAKIQLKEAQNDLDKKGALLWRIEFLGGTSAQNNSGGVINTVIDEMIHEAEIRVLQTDKEIGTIAAAIEIASKFEDLWEPDEDDGEIDSELAQFA